MHLKVIFTYLLIFAWSQTSVSQQLDFRQYSMPEGLPSSTVYSITQDKRGMIWIGTDGIGVVRTDGVVFDVFDSNNGLPGNDGRAIYEDSRGRIWIGTDLGLTCYDGKKFCEFNLTEGAEDFSITRIAEDTAGVILIGTNVAGLLAVSIGEDTTIQSFTTNNGLSDNFIFDIHVDSRNRYWVCNRSGVDIISFPLDSGEPAFTSLVGGLHFPRSNIHCVSSGPEEHLWFGTQNNGVFRVKNDADLSTLEISSIKSLSFLKNETIWDIQWTDSSTCWIATESLGLVKVRDEEISKQITIRHGLPTNQIYRITSDGENGLWLATLGNGAIRYGGDSFVKYGLNPARVGVDVHQIIEIDTTELLVSTDEGLYGINLNDRLSSEIRKISLKNFPYESNINSISKDHHGGIWLGTDHGLFKLSGNRIEDSGFNQELSSTQIRVLYTDRSNRIWVGTNKGINVFSDEGVIFQMTEEDRLINNEIQTIFEDNEGNIWIGTLGGLVRISETYRDFNQEEGLGHLQVNTLVENSNGEILIGTFGGGIYILKEGEERVVIRQLPGNSLISSKFIFSLVWEDPSTLIATTELGFDRLTIVNDTIVQVVHYDSDDGFCKGSNNINAVCRDSRGVFWFGTSNTMVEYDPKLDNKSSLNPVAFITELRMDHQVVNWADSHEVHDWFNLPKNLVLSHKENNLTFLFTAIYFNNPRDLEFSYSLENISNSWSPFSKERSVTFQGLPHGQYKLLLKARSNDQRESRTISYDFRIQPPFWLRAWFIAVLVFLLVILVAGIIRLRTHALQQEQVRLKNIVDLRTWEITQQKEQIIEQRDVLAIQQAEITDSIEYAQHIQQAMLPGVQFLKENFSENFVMLLPQSIVSGDFYWIGKHHSHLVVVAADCTGHGVPGAFMSMLGISFLNKIVKELGIVDPSVILNELRINVLSTFQQPETKENRSHVGIDMSICSYDIPNERMYFAGAMNSLIQVTKTDEEYCLIEHKADKMPVGHNHIMNDFTQQEIKVKKGDSLYLFSDGYRDQFGGEKNKRFMKRRFKEMLQSHQELTMNEQREKFEQILFTWICGDKDMPQGVPQTDDILLMGIRL